MSDDRLERVEQRLAVLERLVREIVADRPGLRAPASGPRVEAAATPAAQEPATAVAGMRNPAPGISPPLSPASPPRNAEPGATPRAPLISEEWLGQRGLLAVGVVFVVLAAGYLLKLSFDRGWISPLVRCLGGTASGAILGALGWRLHGRGTRSYGAALIGTGAAIIYLAAWAAGRLYQFLPPTTSVLSLALVSIALAAIAWAIDIQALGAAAALGAFFAPIVIGKEAASVDLLLLYLAGMALGLGSVAALRRWRLTTFIVALAYFGFATSGLLNQAIPGGLYLYGVLGGAAGLFVGLREGWWETRLLAFTGGWAVLAMANDHITSHWLTLVGGVVLCAPVWWRALRAAVVWPGQAGSSGWRPGDTFYFYLSPLLLSWAVTAIAPAFFRRNDGLAALLVAVPYLGVGLAAARRPFALVAAAALGLAAIGQWAPLTATWTLLLLAPAWALMDHLLQRDDGRWYAVATLAAAVALLYQTAGLRPNAEPAFTGPWALTLWWATAIDCILAARLLRDPPAPALALPQLRPALWIAGGALLLLGVTEELLRWATQAGLTPATARLAGGLAVSAWWILFAAGCFVLGFLRAVRPLRLAGFLVAGLALMKVLLWDLSTLEAFYRIGSALILGVVSLAVAYAYHRRAEAERP
jgi:Predicted membrane protein (DUF2339)